MGLICYPGNPPVFARCINGEIVDCPDQEAAKREWEQGQPGALITDPQEIQRLMEKQMGRPLPEVFE